MTDEYTPSQITGDEKKDLVKVDLYQEQDVSKMTATSQKSIVSFQQLRQSVADAYYLHNYSITTGKDIPEEISAVIVKMKRTFEQGEELTITSDEEVEFSTAYRQLAARMLPVTVESLRDTEDVQYEVERPFLRRFRLSKARQVIILLPLFAIFLIFIIIYSEILQSIFLVGLNDIAEKQTQLTQLNERLVEEQQELDSLQQLEQRAKSQGKNRALLPDEPGSEDTSTPPPINQIAIQVEEQQVQLTTIEDQSNDLSADVDARLKSLKSIWDNLPLHLPLLESGYEQDEWIYDEGSVTLVRMKFELLAELLNRLLPVLYGALGATAYLLRMLIPHIRNRTFNKNHAGSFSVRICLGMLSGIAIQWFLSNDQQQAQIFERALSTSALAFLAGYSVDLLFNIMDWFIVKFKIPKASQQSSSKSP